MAIQDLTGLKFGRLTVKCFVEKKHGDSILKCMCDCGKESNVGYYKLKSGHTKSCGCLIKEKLKTGLRYTHGQSIKGKRATEYITYYAMLDRCYNKKSEFYNRYGGRGITVCDEWRSGFEYFILDMGKKPNPKMSIERIDNNKGYHKENCKWATKKEQANNRISGRKITIGNETKSVIDWSKHSPVNYKTIMSRLHTGWDAKDAVTCDKNTLIKTGKIRKEKTQIK